MTSPVCVDANVVLSIVLNEPAKGKAEKLFTELILADIEIIAPTLFAYEVTSVIRTKVHRQLILPEEGLMALKRAFGLNVILQRPEQLHEHAWQLAEQFGRPAAYDAHYLALAEIFNCHFWTADERLYNAVKSQLPWVYWLGHYP